MEWFKVSEQEPKQFQEVIVCLNDGCVKSATYVGEHKWTTYRTVVLWSYLPETPWGLLNENENTTEEPQKKKRGRKKKVKEE